MSGVKFMVLYPRPTDIDAFEKVYQEEHVPMAVKISTGGKPMFMIAEQQTFIF